MSAEDEDDDKLETDEAEAEAEEAADADADAGSSRGAREEPVEFHSSETRRKLRDQLEAEIQAFLASGGSIEQVDANTSARPAIITASVGDEVS